MSSKRNASETFIVHLRGEPDGEDGNGFPPVYRLKRLLKDALRRYALRCVHVETREAHDEH